MKLVDIRQNIVAFLLVAFLIFLLISLIPHGTAYSGQALETSDIVERKVIDELQNNDSVRVIVTLKNEISPHNFLKSSSLSSENEAIQNKTLFLTVNETSLIKIINETGVERVSFDYPISPGLQDSVPLISADKAWQKMVYSSNLTGKGQTICIIDTGVNYNHPDLGGCFGNNDPSSNCKILGGHDFGDNDNNPLDYNGHGTHVAGIVAANGSIKGVAPESKIISLKVFSDSGKGYLSYLISAIDWCTENSKLYNISTITMSLELCAENTCSEKFLSEGNCDDNFIELSEAVNRAYAKNISVIAATGNEGNNKLISAPACIQNTIKVAATEKNDAIASFSNRNSFTKLSAPGVDIRSTGGSRGCYLEGNYGICSGTSMSAPHVAGAIAIINQYLKQTGQAKTPKQIEDILARTGDRVSDPSGNSLVFSRINADNALLYLDNIPPEVTIDASSSFRQTLNGNYNLTCNFSDWQLKKSIFYLWNSSGLYYNESKNISGSSFSQSFIINNLSRDTYAWNCLGVDVNNNEAFAKSNSSLLIEIIVSLLQKESRTLHQNQTFQCRADSLSQLTNVTFYLWNSTSGIFNKTSSLASGNNFTYEINVSNLTEGSYSWNCLFTDENNNSAFAASNNSLVYDTNSPQIALVSPAENFTAFEHEPISFVYNFSDSDFISNCSFIIENFTREDKNLLSKRGRSSFSQSLPSGVYSWEISCEDSAGNIGNSTQRKLIINSRPAQSEPKYHYSSGSGGNSPSRNHELSTASTIYLNNSYPDLINNTSRQANFSNSNFNESKKTSQARTLSPNDSQPEIKEGYFSLISSAVTGNSGSINTNNISIILFVLIFILFILQLKLNNLKKRIKSQHLKA